VSNSAPETYSSLRELTRTRFLEFLREPEALFWSLVFPVLLAIGLGIAFRNRPPETEHVAVTGAGASASRVLAALRAGKGIAAESLSDDDALTALRTGRVALVVHPYEDGKIEYRYDDTREDARAARLLADDAIQRGAGRRDPLAVEERQVRERGSRYIDFVVPGLLGMNLMGGGIWGIGFTVVDARRKRLLKRLMATPMSRAEYLGSYVVSRFVLLTVEVVVILGFAVLAFGVPLRGSLGGLTLICGLSALCFGALGLLIAARPRTIEGASGLMNVTMMPMWVLSGVFFSSENFPRAFQPLIQALPLTAVNNALRANMLRGAEFTAVAPELGVIAAWTIVCFALALWLFRWR
jgi:ABC-type multidrug transport system permease subunit